MARPEKTAHSRRSRRGFTLLEVMISVLLLVIGIAGISRLTVGITRAGNLQRETERATEGARATIERIKCVAFSQAFRSYNATGLDDPGIPGTAPGANFAVPGLRAAPDDADSLCGEIIFPTAPDHPEQLRENVDDPKIGMPRDLNGDGAIDSVSHHDNYKLLPVRVRVVWQSVDGTIGTVELKTNLANY